MRTKIYGVVTKVLTIIEVHLDEFEESEQRSFQDQDAIADAEHLLTDTLDRGMDSGFFHKFESCLAIEAKVVSSDHAKLLGIN